MKEEFAFCGAWLIDSKIALVSLASKFNTVPNSSVPNYSSKYLKAPDLRPISNPAVYIDDHGTGQQNIGINFHSFLLPPVLSCFVFSAQTAP